MLKTPSYSPPPTPVPAPPGCGIMIPKPPEPPDNPLMSYLRYSRKVWDQVKAFNSDETGKIIRGMRRDLTDENQWYLKEYKAKKVEYHKPMKAYRDSPAHRAINARGRAAAALEEESGQRQPGTETGAPRAMSAQPAEDSDDYDQGFQPPPPPPPHPSFQRNRQPLSEVAREPGADVSSVTIARIQVLGGQVQPELETNFFRSRQHHQEEKGTFPRAQTRLAVGMDVEKPVAETMQADPGQEDSEKEVAEHGQGRVVPEEEQAENKADNKEEDTASLPTDTEETRLDEMTEGQDTEEESSVPPGGKDSEQEGVDRMDEDPARDSGPCSDGTCALAKEPPTEPIPEGGKTE
uniref:HMG box domain-containing protein n=1 Tax=Otolemur garnettii TaxID=30611 RepID=H0XMR6_OTOGA